MTTSRKRRVCVGGTGAGSLVELAKKALTLTRHSARWPAASEERIVSKDETRRPISSPRG